MIASGLTKAIMARTISTLVMVTSPLAVLISIVSFLWGAWWLGLLFAVGVIGLYNRKVPLALIVITCIAGTLPFTLNQISNRINYL